MTGASRGIGRAVALELAAAGAAVVVGYHRQREQAEAVALAQAVQDAQRQAAVLARALGVALGPVREAVVEPAPGAAPFLARSAAEGLPLLPGRLTVARSVRVVYPILGPAAG